MKSSELERLKPLAPTSYAVAVLLMVIPVVDTVLSVLPPRLGDVTWRFGALGLGSQAVMTPLLGGLLVLVTAGVLEHRWVARAVQILAWLVAVALVAAIALFVLDALQVRASVKADAQGAFGKASLVALGKYAVGVAVSVMFAIASHRLIRRLGTSAAADSDKAQLVFEAAKAKS